MKISEGRVVIGEPLVFSAGRGGDGVHTLIVSPEEDYERSAETTSHIRKGP